jgi:hypothetical protein
MHLLWAAFLAYFDSNEQPEWVERQRKKNKENAHFGVRFSSISIIDVLIRVCRTLNLLYRCVIF